MKRILLDFDILFDKYKDILSVKELYEFSNQLSEQGYVIALERKNNNLYYKIEKPSFRIYLKRLLNIFNNQGIYLKDYQKLTYKIF